MTANQIRKRVTNRGEALGLAADLYHVESNCEGTPEQCFLSGLWNAETMVCEERTLNGEDSKEYLRFAFSELNNMYPRGAK